MLGQLLTESDSTAPPITEIDSIPVVPNFVLDFDFVAVLPERALASLDARLAVLSIDPATEFIVSLAWATDGRRGARCAVRQPS